MKNTNAPLYQHVRAELVPPRIKTLAADWQLWDSAQEGTEGTIHIDYDGEYGSERMMKRSKKCLAGAIVAEMTFQRRKTSTGG